MGLSGPQEEMVTNPFEFGWYCWDLGEYRPFPVRHSTYWLFPYDELPPLAPPKAPFGFLLPDADKIAQRPWIPKNKRWLLRRLDRLTGEALQLGLTLPDTFVPFMSSPELHTCFREGTGYWFTLSNHIVRCPGFDDGYLICFLRDQQDCLIWCLCLTSDGRNCVLAMSEETTNLLPEYSRDGLYGDLDADEEGDRDDLQQSGGDTEIGRTSRDVATALNDVRICAESFGTFIHRFWLEDEIGCKLMGIVQAPLTDEERRYVAHYEGQIRSRGQLK